jgi:myo-inositol-1(or 4)-monophosphatase
VATTTTEPELATLRELVRQCAAETIIPLTLNAARHFKEDGSVVTEADQGSHEWLERELTKRWPPIGFLSEEMPSTEQEAALTHSNAGYWCLDPLDGTSNFASGIPFFAVSLALVTATGTKLAVIYDPVRDETFSAARGQGAFLGNQRLGVVEAPPLHRCLAAVDMKRLTPELRLRLAKQAPYGSQRNFGACALEWAWLAAGRFQLYLHGGQKFWDYAAGLLILEEAGGAAESLDGKPVFSGTLSSRSAVATLDPERFDEWRNWVTH